ncbi:SGNH/GDSL hydrolase family protein [Georgenia alba]|uniref:SGNH/GDSL hydrolase family protein n=1 Tax=Georgenia alba TaxID=2233858 RepID=A0ABW2QB98_9MICO
MRRTLAGILLLIVLGLSACATPDGAERAAGGAAGDGGAAAAGPERPGAAHDPQPHTVRMAAVGDSITEARSPDFAAGDLNDLTWVSHAVGDDLELAGGWARGGATTAEMAAHVTPVDADVLVVLGGTNDVWQGLTADGHAETLANIRRVVDTVGADEVVLSAIPPLDRMPAAAAALNTSLEDLAHDSGWHWVDAPAPLREDDRFVPGLARDGVHPTREGAELLGAELRRAALEAAR